MQAAWLSSHVQPEQHPDTMPVWQLCSQVYALEMYAGPDLFLGWVR